jgi:glycosyltransferase involved in cell wall biosynthesis
LQSLDLTHFSYDSPWNPWFGGGGAQRDWEILRRLPESWKRTYAVGGFPGCRKRSEPVLQWLGSGEGRWSSRVSYVRAASAYARRHPPVDGIWSVSPSVFAPVPAYLAHPDRTAISLFHLVGWNAWRKYGPMGLLAVWHEGAILRRGRHFLCINRATADEVGRRRPDASVHIVPTGFTPLGAEGVARVPGRILFLGRMDLYMKGLDRLLAAFRIVAENDPRASLVVAGRSGATERSRLGRLFEGHPARARIQVVENPTDEEKSRLFREASVFCSPSRFEGWCIAAVEAQSCAVPVVATTADGFLDSVDDGRSGILVDNREESVVPKIAEALSAILGDTGLATRLGEGGLAKAAGLTWDAVASRHDEIFRAIRADG